MSRVLESEFSVLFFTFWNYLIVGTKYVLFVVVGNFFCQKGTELIHDELLNLCLLNGL